MGAEIATPARLTPPGAYNPPPVRSLRLAAVVSLLAFAPLAPAALWPLPLERLIAADAAFYAPPDLKRQLAKNRDRLMAGVTDARSGDRGGASPQRRAAAARAARNIAAGIRSRQPFADVAFAAGALVHEAAAAFPPPPGSGDDRALLGVAKTARFLGFPREAFAAPEALAALPLSDTSARQAYDAAVTLSTRLLTWVWKQAGGDVSVAAQHPETKGPYVVRE